MSKKIRLMELFGGIGAFSKACNNINLEHEIVDYVEIKASAIKIFNLLNNTDFKAQNISNYNKKHKNIDIIMHGSPCQNFSAIGDGAGGDEGSNTKSSLLYESLRIIGETKPKCVVWENVKGVLHKQHKHNFENYLKQMENFGYKNYYKILNSADYNSAQRRLRIFIVSIKKELCKKDFEFPEPLESKVKYKDILEENPPEKYYLPQKYIDAYSCMKDRNGFVRGKRFKLSLSNINNLKDYANTLTTKSCYMSVTNNYIYMEDGRLRGLTPLECTRLMGFSDEDYQKIVDNNISNGQIYFCMGNSIVVNVLEELIKSIIAIIE